MRRRKGRRKRRHFGRKQRQIDLTKTLRRGARRFRGKRSGRHGQPRHRGRSGQPGTDGARKSRPRSGGKAGCGNGRKPRRQDGRQVGLGLAPRRGRGSRRRCSCRRGKTHGRARQINLAKCRRAGRTGRRHRGGALRCDLAETEHGRLHRGLRGGRSPSERCGKIRVARRRSRQGSNGRSRRGPGGNGRRQVECFAWRANRRRRSRHWRTARRRSGLRSGEGRQRDLFFAGLVHHEAGAAFGAPHLETRRRHAPLVDLVRSVAPLALDFEHGPR